MTAQKIQAHSAGRFSRRAYHARYRHTVNPCSISAYVHAYRRHTSSAPTAAGASHGPAFRLLGAAHALDFSRDPLPVFFNFSRTPPIFTNEIKPEHSCSGSLSALSAIYFLCRNRFISFCFEILRFLKRIAPNNLFGAITKKHDFTALACFFWICIFYLALFMQYNPVFTPFIQAVIAYCRNF